MNDKTTKIVLGILCGLLLVAVAAFATVLLLTPKIQPLEPKVLGAVEFNVHQTATNSNVSITTASTRVVATSTARESFIAVNDGAYDMYLCRADVCAVNTGILLNARGGTYEMEASDAYSGSITAIASGGTSNLAISYKQ